MENLPVCKRCCFCLPLRYGLLTWGYLKLIAAFLVLSVLSISMNEFKGYIIGSELVIFCIILAVLVVDIILHILFIIGGHNKNVKLLTMYYYYVLSMCILTILLAVACTGLMIAIVSGILAEWPSWLLLIDIVSFIVSIVMQTYFLLLLRSEIIKLRSNCPYRFVKNATDSDGTINYEEESTVERGARYIYEKETS